MLTKRERRLKIKRRVRRNIFGTAQKPRLTVFRSNKQIYVQIINDQDGRTLVAASSLSIEEKLSKKEMAVKVGEDIARKALAIGLETIVFDRNGFLYHGRIKELAEAARKGGLKF